MLLAYNALMISAVSTTAELLVSLLAKQPFTPLSPLPVPLAPNTEGSRAIVTELPSGATALDQCVMGSRHPTWPPCVRVDDLIEAGAGIAIAGFVLSSFVCLLALVAISRATVLS